MAPSPPAYAASSSTSELAPVRLPLESLSSVIRFGLPNAAAASPT